MSSHREAPLISKDPVADNTDVYAFVSPDAPNTVTLIANYIPAERPDSGPNFYEFGDDVLYEIHIDNNGDSSPDITYQFRFTTHVQNPNTFLYNTGPITSLTSSTFNRRQVYTVTKVVQTGGPNGPTSSTVLGSNLPCPPCNIGPRSTPNYAALASSAINTLPNGYTVFAGQRREGFYVDLGSVFDLAALRPFQSLHVIHPPNNAPGVDSLSSVNVHSIALQVPITELTGPNNNKVIGVYASASRQRIQILGVLPGLNEGVGPFVQVSRLGNPLINEVIIPMGKKDLWNSAHPATDAQFLQYYAHPEVSSLLPVLYPGVFPNLAALTAARADLVAILLTGIPAGIISPTFTTYTGSVQADLLRLNMAIAPTTTNPSIYGVLGNDVAGFPNGRRVFDDVATIEIRALAGATYPLVAPSYTPDGAAAVVTDYKGISYSDIASRYISTFPYLGTPLAGYDVPSNTLGS